ncbi:hypothetical protein COY61_00390 [bacterium (Candidatus Gribaldobacteria) CG_4_10_14_0_8_um_filter_33_9]|uniref:Uncharacterized protein n=1 Tax=bacterium (Candidatus Gribaldobacteria) CG_4_10_14_0_8_um_filter_33_9 TaxID=2014266 RepID=A0A2M7RP10_9BACT|nr:MAG: hypothetical protein COY61_00390 [bacterium (Candidatus Gribaldobacteria) CG_4_10_14_0_8_um_filter_33_9]
MNNQEKHVGNFGEILKRDMEKTPKVKETIRHILHEEKGVENPTDETSAGAVLNEVKELADNKKKKVVENKRKEELYNKFVEVEILGNLEKKGEETYVLAKIKGITTFVRVPDGFWVNPQKEKKPWICFVSHLEEQQSKGKEGKIYYFADLMPFGGKKQEEKITEQEINDKVNSGIKMLKEKDLFDEKGEKLEQEYLKEAENNLLKYLEPEIFEKAKKAGINNSEIKKLITEEISIEEISKMIMAREKEKEIKPQIEIKEVKSIEQGEIVEVRQIIPAKIEDKISDNRLRAVLYINNKFTAIKFPAFLSIEQVEEIVKKYDGVPIQYLTSAKDKKGKDIFKGYFDILVEERIKAGTKNLEITEKIIFEKIRDYKKMIKQQIRDRELPVEEAERELLLFMFYNALGKDLLEFEAENRRKLEIEEEAPLTNETIKKILLKTKNMHFFKKQNFDLKEK